MNTKKEKTGEKQIEYVGYPFKKSAIYCVHIEDLLDMLIRAT